MMILFYILIGITISPIVLEILNALLMGMSVQADDTNKQSSCCRSGVDLVTGTKLAEKNNEISDFDEYKTTSSLL